MLKERVISRVIDPVERSGVERKVMKLACLGVGLVVVAAVLGEQTAHAQAPATVKVLGCLQGDGSEQKPWMLSGVALPAPPAAAAPAGGRGRGGGAGAPAPPPPPPPPVALVDLRLAGGMNMSIWRGMKIEVEGTLGAKPANGPQELRATSARSVQGVCTPK